MLWLWKGVPTILILTGGRNYDHHALFCTTYNKSVLGPDTPRYWSVFSCFFDLTKTTGASVHASSTSVFYNGSAFVLGVTLYPIAKL